MLKKFKCQKPIIHDNTDDDVISINKSKLSSIIQLAKEFYISSSITLVWLGFAITFATTALVTEKFKDIGVIPGETIRMVYIVLSLVTFVLFVRNGIKWLRLKNRHEPEVLVDELLNNKPKQLNRDRTKNTKKKNKSIAIKDFLGILFKKY